MVITKNNLQHIVDEMPEAVEVKEIFDKILISAKVDRALEESSQGLGQDWEDFKKEWL